jgi:hypothetical protein
MFCQKCGTENKDGAAFCNSCGADLRLAPIGQSSSEKPAPKHGILYRFAVVVVVIFVLFIGIAIVMDIAGMDQGVSQSSTPPVLTTAQIKSQAQSISVANLMRYPDTYKNSIVHFRGKVVQVQNLYGNNYYLRMDTKSDQYLGYFGDTIYIDYQGDRLLEDDVIDVWGKFAGLKSYTAVLGNEITLPEINSLHVEMVKAST